MLIVSYKFALLCYLLFPGAAIIFLFLRLDPDVVYKDVCAVFFLCEVIESNSSNRWCLYNLIDTKLLVTQDERKLDIKIGYQNYFSTTH